ncbi:hypothetical protein GCM10025867_39090 [Frondihabitans sucicola]|uniref:Uncharacterized protein n=1 Tax=Frondihabitans sucicola TaxID=1268041 RepID=A0ABN6Y812_9MICO|nr:hypothetical protein GCM10025867_39090 [Frondihabitans sucicola]
MTGKSSDIGVLEVENQGARAHLLKISHLIGIPDDADRVVAGIRQKAFEEQGDLAVATGDDDSHGHIQSRRPARVMGVETTTENRLK